MVEAVGAAIIEDGRLLLVEEKGVYKLPGGTIEEGESDEDTLRREMDEEVAGVGIKNIRFYGEFEGISPVKKNPIKLRVYLADREDCSMRKEDIRPSGEIDSIAWVLRNEAARYNLSSITLDVALSLSRSRLF